MSSILSWPFLALLPYFVLSTPASPASKAMSPILYMWSAMLSGPLMPIRIQPVLLVSCNTSAFLIQLYICLMGPDHMPVICDSLVMTRIPQDTKCWPMYHMKIRDKGSSCLGSDLLRHQRINLIHKTSTFKFCDKVRKSIAWAGVVCFEDIVRHRDARNGRAGWFTARQGIILISIINFQVKVNHIIGSAHRKVLETWFAHIHTDLYVYRYAIHA